MAQYLPRGAAGVFIVKWQIQLGSEDFGKDPVVELVSHTSGLLEAMGA